jgi:hypothetical protein
MIGSMSTADVGAARMESVEQPPTSPRLSAAASAERERLSRRVQRLEAEVSTAAAELQRLIDARQVLRERITLLEQLSPSEPQSQLSLVGEQDAELAPEPMNGWLRGARIRSVAVHLLAASDHSKGPIHYSEWFDQLEQAGFGVAGKDPVAAFLTQISRSPVVEKADGPGLYRLDLSAPAELQERLRALQQELRQLHDGQQTLEEIATVRERRTELMTELGRTERALEEAARDLGLAPRSTLSDYVALS